MSAEDRAKALATRQNTAPVDGWRERVRKEAADTVREGRANLAAVNLPATVCGALDEFATLAAIGRTAVPRDGYGKREIIGVPIREEPYRIAGQLHALAAALFALGVSEADALDLARRCALDSMPGPRSAVLRALAAGEPLLTAQVAKAARLDRKIARFALEDLACTGACTYVGAADDYEEQSAVTRKEWHLIGPDAPLIARVLATELGRKGGTTHHTPQVQGTHGSSHSIESVEELLIDVFSDLPTCTCADPTQERHVVDDIYVCATCDGMRSSAIA